MAFTLLLAFSLIGVSIYYVAGLQDTPTLATSSFIDYDATIGPVSQGQLDVGQAARLADLEMYFQGSKATDGTDYHFLVNACRDIERLNVPGITLEIGTRLGGSSYLLMRETSGRTHVAVDPYGHMDYRLADGHVFPGLTSDYNYGNMMRNAALANLYTYAYYAQKNFVFFNMDDGEWFARFANGVPIYERGNKTLATQFALVYFDGPHTTKDLIFEIGFAAPRTPVGGRWILDNVGSFRFDARIHPLVVSLGFKMVEISELKASYLREEAFV